MSTAYGGDPWLVNAVAEHFGYVSSLLWGLDTTMPAVLEAPFFYAEDGCTNLGECPDTAGTKTCSRRTT